jgi:hypothetical protein
MDFQNGEREFLTANRAIKVDEDGIERYVGLTDAESVDYLALSRRNDTGGLAGADQVRYAALHDKHETARQVYARGEKSLHPSQKP